MFDLMLYNAIVITMDEARRVIDNGAVIIHNGKIEKVCPSAEAENIPVREKIDMKDHVLLPGFVDAHGHGGHTAFKSIVTDTSWWMPVMTHIYKNYITDDFWYNEGRLSALERVHSGVTTGVCVLGSQPRCDSPVPAMNNSKAYAEIGIRDIVCTGPCSVPWPHRFSRYTPDKKRVQKEVSYEEVLDSLETVVSTLNHANGDRTRAFVTPFGLITSVDPSAPTPADRCVRLTEHDMRQAKDMRRIAAKYNTRIHTDAFGGMVHLAKEDRNALLGPDVHLQHCVGLSMDEVMTIVKTDTHVSVTPGFSHMNRHSPVIEFLEMGVKLALTSDGSMLTSSFNMFDVMKRGQKIYRGIHREDYYLPGEKCLELVTIDAATVLGMEKEVGSLEKGKKADVISVDMRNPRLRPYYNIIDTLIGNGTPADIDNVLVDGQFVLKDRRAVNADEDEIIGKAETEVRETVERTPYLKNFACPGYKQWGNVKAVFDTVRFDIEENRRDGGHY